MKTIPWFPELKQQVKTLQKVLAIQPNTRTEHSQTSNAHLEASELCALIESIPLWRVTEKMVQPLRRVDPHRVFGSGKLEELTNHIAALKKREGLTGVVLGLNTLTSSQLMTLEKLWSLRVYDRFSVILEIFRARAVSNEAKMQVALAEISYLRSNLYTFHHNNFKSDHHKDSLEVLGGSGEVFLSTRKHLLREREERIKKEVEKIASQKELFRSSRKKADLPVIAVVGYTNAGKTSLIQCLTGDASITPEDRLFATLDVTTFTGFLPNNLKVLYVDTIGFISNIPPSLFDAFNASLQEIAYADLLMIVTDSSHPDKSNQNRVVIETLKRILKRHSSTNSSIDSSTDSSIDSSTDSSIKSSTDSSISSSINSSTISFTTLSSNSSSNSHTNSAISISNPKFINSSVHPLLQNLVFVHNKTDLLSHDDRNALKASFSSPNEVMVSLKEGWGVPELISVMQGVLGKVTGMVTKRLRVPIGGSMLSWLYKEAVVESVMVDPKNSEKYLLKVKMTPLVNAKFSLKFKPKK